MTTSLTLNFCYCQTSDLCGLYVNQDGANRELDLRPDFTYNYYSQGGCGLIPAYKDTGVYTRISDTIFLQPNDKTQKQEKFLFVTRLPSDKKAFWFWEIGTIAKMFKSDSILSSDQSGRLSDHEALYFGSYVKKKGYYNSGKTMFKIETREKIKIITNYFESGKVKSIEQYLDGKKTGDWFYYKENGEIKNIETYSKDKLKRKKTKLPITSY